MSAGDETPEDPDRAAILGRRAKLVGAMLAGLGIACGGHADGAEGRAPSAPSAAPAATAGAGGAARAAPPDTDGDGVADPFDACPETHFGTREDTSSAHHRGCPAPSACLSVVPGPPKVLERIHFDPGSARLSPRAGPILDAVGAALVEIPELAVQVRGSCARGEASLLARRRAEAVRDALLARGVPPARIAVGAAAPCDGDARVVDFPSLAPPP